MKTGVLEDARGALDIMIRDLKNAGSWGERERAIREWRVWMTQATMPIAVCNRVYAASPSMIHVQMDLNGNGNCNDADPRESIRYELTGPTSTCPGPYIIRRNGDCLVANVVPESRRKDFHFF